MSMTRQQRRAAERAAAKKERSEIVILVVTNAGDEDRHFSLALPTTGCIARLADRVYRFYKVSGRTQSQVFRDLDGQQILALRAFHTLEDARAFVDTDARQRGILLASGKDLQTMGVSLQ